MSKSSKSGSIVSDGAEHEGEISAAEPVVDRYNDGYQAGASRYKENTEEGMTRYVAFHKALDTAELQPEEGRYRKGFADGVNAVHGHMKTLRSMDLAHEAAIAELQIEKRSFEK